MRWSLLLVALTTVTLALGSGAPPVAAATDSPILAFFYPWYNKSQFTTSQMWDVPVALYDSDARSTIQSQVSQARGAGVTGFISSWMGIGNRTDRNFATLLDVSKGTDFASTIYLETGSFNSPQEIVAALRYVQSSYGSNPNFARVGGRPAIFVWNPSAAGSLETWRGIRAQVDPNHDWHWNVETDRPDSWLDVFDGIHLFSAASWTNDPTATYESLKSKVQAIADRTGQPKLFAAGVAPGWDNSHQDNPVQVRVARDGGAYYSRRWDAALASDPALVTITSWNEWGEGTEIEPGTSYGNLYLDITKQKAALYRGAGTAAAVAPPGVAFKLGFKLLADQIASVAGVPLENEHWVANGDSLQQTTNGLMVWRKADNWTAFTDGNRTWINGTNGVQSRPNDQRFSWEGQ